MDQFYDEFPETSPNHPNNGFYVGVMTGKMLEIHSLGSNAADLTV